MKVLLVGSRGQLGSALVSCLVDVGVDVIGLNSQQLDILDAQSVLSFAEQSIDLIVNATAYTAVDKAESDVEQAYAVNKQGVINLIALAQSAHVPLINVSTDYVFDGQASSPYKENDPKSPIGVYGASKRAGELALESSTIEFINIRTSWLFGQHGNNFVKTMLRLGSERDELKIIQDQIGCPTYAQDLALAIAHIARVYNNTGVFKSGHYHFCGDVAVSWYEFAKEIFKTGLELGIIDRVPCLSGIPTSEYPTPASRPVYSVMDCEKIAKAYSISTSDWRIGLKNMLSELA
jgi:dTDP-4-dehydrorhamnose reductase